MDHYLFYMFIGILLNVSIILTLLVLPTVTKSKRMLTGSHSLLFSLSLWGTSLMVIVAYHLPFSFTESAYPLVLYFGLSTFFYSIINLFLLNRLARDLSSQKMFMISILFGMMSIAIPMAFMYTTLHIQKISLISVAISLLHMIITLFLIIRVIKQIRIDQFVNFRKVSWKFQVVFAFVGAHAIYGGNLSLYRGTGLIQESEYQLIELTTILLLILITTAYGEKQYLQKQMELEKNNDQLEYLAHHDQLTGLPNRKGLTEFIKDLIDEKKQFHLLFLDLDAFKQINDHYGHHYGDSLLKKLAGRLKECLSEEGVVGRLGGDEFIIVLPGDTLDIEAYLQTIIEKITQPIMVNNKMFSVTTSIGAARYPKDGMTISELMKNADLAMYYSKESGKNRFTICSQAVLKENKRILTLKQDLKDALADGQFSIHYQPQISLLTDQLIGFEALLRWNHPVLGNIPPLTFIPLAEESGQINEIGSWVLKEALTKLKGWQTQYEQQLKISVNISVTQLEHPDFISTVEAALTESRIAPSSVELEVTESLAMSQIEYALQVIEKIRSLGVSISMDDFGAGHSSLNYLRLLKIKHIKIDRSFIQEAGSNGESQEVVKAILSIAEHLQLKVTAEGIETEEQLAFLKSLNCNQGQGFLFSKPLPQEQAEALLKQKYNEHIVYS